MEVRVIRASEPSKPKKLNVPLSAAIGGVSGYALKYALPVTVEDKHIKLLPPLDK